MPASRPAHVVVVGAGLSGLVCARALDTAGLSVTRVDKARGPSGRLATRRTDDLAFDHGAQFFTARGQPFREEVGRWCAAGVAALWDPRIVRIDRDGTSPARPSPRFVGVPGMSTVGRHLLGAAPVSLRRRIVALHSEGRGYALEDEVGERLEADAVVLALPAPQAAELLAGPHPALAGRAAAASMAPCWALMVAFAEPPDAPFDAAFVDGGPLAWACREASKPGRTPGPRWVLHAAPDWTRRHRESDPDSVTAELLAAFERCAGAPLPQAVHAVTHRWAHALPQPALGAGCLGAGRLAVCGDWCHGARVEGAFLSGRAAAERLLTVLGR